MPTSSARSAPARQGKKTRMIFRRSPERPADGGSLVRPLTRSSVRRGEGALAAGVSREEAVAVCGDLVADVRKRRLVHLNIRCCVDVERGAFDSRASQCHRPDSVGCRRSPAKSTHEAIRPRAHPMAPRDHRANRGTDPWARRQTGRRAARSVCGARCVYGYLTNELP